MKIIKGIKVGGLQQKIISLFLLFIIALIGAYAAVAAYQQKNLSNVVQEASVEQQASITAVSEKTMEAVLNTSMVRSTALQAYIANDLFMDVQTDVRTLQTFAEELFAHADSFTPHPYYDPDPAKDGIATVQVQHEAGVDPADSETLGLVANMSEVMLAMFEHSDKLSSCFVATADGCILYVDDRSGAYVSEDGQPITFETRQRPWYKQAAEAGDLIFTGVELDAFTDIPGLVCAAPVYRGGELVAVVGADIFLTSISDYVQDTASEGGFLCVINEDGQVLFSPQQAGVFKAELSDRGADLRATGNEELADFVRLSLSERTPLTLLEIDGTEYYLTGAPMETLGWAVISVVEKEVTNRPAAMMLSQYEKINDGALSSYEAGAKQSAKTILVLTIGILVLAILGALILGTRIVRPLERLTRAINAQGNGGSAFTMDDGFRTGDEIEVLAESFAELNRKAQEYIEEIITVTAEKKRIGTELALAQRIQADMLPNIFPPFPDRSDFDVYASMDPAKEVGGDFYDFFLIDETHLGLVMADVSGKGVPAALFMMISKILVQNYAMTGFGPAQVLQAVNDQICANNHEEMFVTVWFGILDTETGKITVANAGHEYPVLMHAGGQFELLKDRHGFVIGGMEGVRYREYELALTPGSKLFLYTDGVPEATDADNNMFGTDRMLAAMNADPSAPPDLVLRHVREAVDAFVKDAEQFDDLTMLCLEYKGGSERMNKAYRELTLPAEVEKLPEALSFVEALLEEAGCSMKAQMQISVAVEEIFVNIASYAYAPDSGDATIRVEFPEGSGTVKLTFIDSGTPFDPLEREDPDISLSSEERDIGGLGIYMIKKTMDELRYEYADGQNRLTLIKKI
ncbi:MAG: SpoIIE family protein phosphatase [Oscillospiraceae bacterium]|nr:SpoIIE family protein phosphatase [Oscillospiraceae bacterium]